MTVLGGPGTQLTSISLCDVISLHTGGRGIMRASHILIGAALVLGGCSSQPVHKKQSGEMNAYDVSEPSVAALMPAQPGEPPVANPKPIEVSLPRLAYAYLLAFRLPDARIPDAQEGHRMLCEQMGA